MSVFKHLRDKKGWTVYQAAKELQISFADYVRLEEGTRGERFVKLLFKMQKVTDSNLSEIKKILKETTKKK